MPENFMAEDLNQINDENETKNQFNLFPQTTKLLNNELKDKKDTILNVLKDGNLEEVFEGLISSEIGEFCIFSLLDCGNNEEEIKQIILENLPEKYAYNISNDKVLIKAVTIDQKMEQAQADKEQAEEKKEQAEEKKEQAEEKKDQAEEKKDQAEEKKEQAEINKEQLESIVIMKNAREERDRLLSKYQNLGTVTNEDSEHYKEIKQQLENDGVLNQLRENRYDEQFINDYILAQTTLNELKSNPANYEKDDISLFDKIVKNLNNACNIPDTSFDSFSENNISNTRAELFHETIGNKGLIEQRQRNIETHSSDYERLFSIESDDELIQNYGRFLDGGGKKLMEKWLSNPTSLSGEENSNLMDLVLLKQKEIEDKTKNMVEEMCMTSQVKGFLSCIPKEYVNQFQFNKANEIHVDQNGILQIDGHVNGVKFSLRQNTNDVNARLQTSTILSKDQDNNFDFTGKYKNSPFILPTSSQVFDTALLSLQSEELSRIQNQDDYFNLLQDSILKDVNKLYTNTKYTHHYIDSQIKTDLLVNDTKKIIFNLGGIDLGKIGESDGKFYELFDMIYYNLQGMTNRKKQKFLECMNKLGNIISSEGHESGNDNLAKNEMLSRFLGSKEVTRKILEKTMLTEDEQKSWSFFDFFKLFLNKGKINVDSLYKFLSNPNENGEDIWAKFDQINGTDTRNEYLDANLEVGLQEAFMV